MPTGGQNTPTINNEVISQLQESALRAIADELSLPFVSKMGEDEALEFLGEAFQASLFCLTNSYQVQQPSSIASYA